MILVNVELEEFIWKRRNPSPLANPFFVCLVNDSNKSLSIRRSPSLCNACGRQGSIPSRFSHFYTSVSKNIISESNISALNSNCIVVQCTVVV